MKDMSILRRVERGVFSKFIPPHVRIMGGDGGIGRLGIRNDPEKFVCGDPIITAEDDDLRRTRLRLPEFPAGKGRLADPRELGKRHLGNTAIGDAKVMQFFCERFHRHLHKLARSEQSRRGVRTETFSRLFATTRFRVA